MSREIKFRVYDQTSKNYKVYGIGEAVNEHFGLGNISRIVWWLKDIKHKFIIEQYTGLKDKNGKEIYEGDILAAKYDGEIVRAAEVYWDEGVHGFDYHIVTGSPDNVFSWLEEYEVVGNVHENLEPLGGEE